MSQNSLMYRASILAVALMTFGAMGTFIALQGIVTNLPFPHKFDIIWLPVNLLIFGLGIVLFIISYRDHKVELSGTP